MRKAVTILSFMCLPLPSGCSLDWLFATLFDNPQTGANGSRADRLRTAEREGRVTDENSNRYAGTVLSGLVLGLLSRLGGGFFLAN